MTEATYSDAKMKLRKEVLAILLKKYSHENDNRAIYECANEWVEKGFATTQGIVKYYQTYYESRQT